jgi:hypothetical protein
MLDHKAGSASLDRFLPGNLGGGRERNGEFMNYRLLTVVFGLLLLGGMLVPNARADEDNKEIMITVNRPVEVPTTVLPPGRYDLKLLGNGSSVAGVWNAEGSHFYGFFETIPVDRNHAIGKAKVVLADSGKNAPKRIEEWFYPGESTGNELLYPVRDRRELER